MQFDETILTDLHAIAELLHEEDEKLYLERQEILAEKFRGKENSLEDIIYDFDEPSVRLEAMMVCKLMETMDRERIFNDLSLAEENIDLKKWAGILYRQEIVNSAALNYAQNRTKGKN